MSIAADLFALRLRYVSARREIDVIRWQLDHLAGQIEEAAREPLTSAPVDCPRPIDCGTH